jgi:hypothetical protein
MEATTIKNVESDKVLEEQLELKSVIDNLELKIQRLGVGGDEEELENLKIQLQKAKEEQAVMEQKIRNLETKERIKENRANRENPISEEEQVKIQKEKEIKKQKLTFESNIIALRGEIIRATIDKNEEKVLELEKSMRELEKRTLELKENPYKLKAA